MHAAETGEAMELSSTEQALESATTVYAVNDGWVTHNATSSTENHYMLGKVWWFMSGDNYYDGFMTFSLGGLPSNAYIKSASLQFTITEVTGNPFDTLDALYVARVSPYTTLGTNLSTAVRYDTKLVRATKPTLPAPISIDVTDMVRNGLDYKRQVYLTLFFPHHSISQSHETAKVSSSRAWSGTPNLRVTYTY
ncbi:hypothetical protein BO221_50510 [Archangium sp. Cb G35]|nr:hypothetical protein BO221_50510 [Archangium sp. Cb G35]